MQAINKYHILPRFVVVMTDWDVLKSINFFQYGISKIIGMCLEWIMREMDHAVKVKKEDLRMKKPGAVTSLEPKFIWIKMIDQPSTGKIMGQRLKFNAVLEETLFNTRSMYIMKIDGEQVLDDSCFDL